MKKLLNIAVAVLASTMLFVGCSNGSAAPAEPEYVDYSVDLTDYQVDLGWYPTFNMLGSDMLGITEKNPKLSFTYTMDEGAEYQQFKIMYGNEPDESAGWTLYDGDLYNEKGVKQTLKEGALVNSEKSQTIYIKPNAKQAAKFARCGIVVQGDLCTLNSFVISYEGVEIVPKNIKNFAKIDGTTSGDAIIMLDPDNANNTVLALEGITSDKSLEASYEYTDLLDFTDLSSVVITLRTGYNLKANANGVVSKESSFKNGFYGMTYVTYGQYSCAVATKDYQPGDKLNDKEVVIAIPKNAIYNPWNVGAGPTKIKEYFADYSDAEEIAYSKITGSAYQGGDLGDGNVYTDAACTNKAEKGIVWDKTPITITLYTDDDNSSSYTFYSKDTDKNYTDKPFSGEYADYTFKFSNFTEKAPDTVNKDGKVTKEGKAVNLKKVKGIKITTNGSEGDLYIKAINFTF